MTESVVFEQAYSTSSWTAPATSSLLTGLYPNRHGVVEGFLAHRQRSEALSEMAGMSISINRIPEQRATLAEVLQGSGYRTWGLSSNINVGQEIGLDRGFDRFDRFPDLAAAEELAGRLRQWETEAGPPSSPCFVYLHFNDVHEPYEERAPWFVPHEGKLERVRSAYDSQISYLDTVIESLYREFHWDRDTIFAVVSDHGEELGERGAVGHHFTLYDELMRVLMVISGPGLEPRRVHTHVSLIDVLPTLVELSGLPSPADLDGWSLVPLLGQKVAEKDSRRFRRRILYAHRLRHQVRLKKPTEHIWAAVRGPWKLIQGPDGSEVYQTDRDPAEKHDRTGQRAEIESDLALGLETLQAEGFFSGEKTLVELDRETLETLETLGYIQ